MFIGVVLQPSTFAALLLPSIAMFLRGRPVAAAVWAAVAATLHSSYLLSAGVLVAVYCGVLLFRDRTPKRALVTGGVALLLVAPTLIYTWLTFRPTSPQVFDEALRVYASVRNVREAGGGVWMTSGAAFQAALVIVAAAVFRRRPVGVVLVGGAVVTAVLTLAQALSSAPIFAMLLPLRMTTWLVPLSTCLLVGAAVTAVCRGPLGLAVTRRTQTRVAAALVVLLAAGGVIDSVHRFRWAQALNDVPLMAFARETSGPDARYLIPPLLQRFRLGAEEPVVVDFKNYPFRDRDVLEWYARYQAVSRFYALQGAPACAALTDLVRRYDPTRVVMADPATLACPTARLAYEDAAFRVYDLRP